MVRFNGADYMAEILNTYRLFFLYCSYLLYKKCYIKSKVIKFAMVSNTTFTQHPK